MCDRTVQFSVLCSMLETVARSKKPALKRKHFRTFFDHVYCDREFFSALRLILPSLDRDRGTYGLKEAVLAKCISDALGLSKESEDAKKLLNWKKGGSSSVGNFPLVAAEILYRRQSASSGYMTIKDVNDLLDRLASAENRDEKTVILSELISKTNAQEMKWIIMFVLKDLKLGVSEKTVLHEFHPDAEDLFNVTCDLKLVCEKLKDRNQRYKRQDIVVGKPVRPQLASRVAGVDDAWKKLKGKRIVAECKFDGDRIQIHKDGNDVHFYSRNFIDHKEYTEGMSAIIIDHVKIEKCILDGEMLVWNRLTNRFAEFGSNQEVAKAAKDGLQTDQQLCFVAFDILYSGDSSVTHQSLSERHLLLKQVVKPLKGSLELLLPESGVGPDNQPCWSMLVCSPEEINKFFLETVENRDEGIVLKDLDSKWEPGDRSGKWVKLKPDYVHAGSDLDALIIGCYLGSGRRGGEIGQFLLGLAERPKHGGYPTRFMSFCKIGSGLSDDERDVLVSKLRPYLRKYEKGSKPPSFYTVTNVAKERPDYWVEQPDKSFVLEITSDIRTIKSEVFAAPYSLRFPRARRVRYDKPWYECLDVESLVELVHSQNGNTTNGKEYGKHTRTKVTKVKRSFPSLPLVPTHMLVTDVSHVRPETSIFKGLVFHFINFEPPFTRDSLHKLVVENGGIFSMNLNDSVTHVIAAERKGMRYQAASRHRDVIHQSWVMDCALEKMLLSIRPKHILHLSKDSNIKLVQDMDDYGDNYFQDIDIEDLKRIFENLVDEVPNTVNKEEMCQFHMKYSAKETVCNFCGYHIYFHNPIHSANLDSQAVAETTLKRLELEVLMHEGEVTCQLKNATHMIIYATDEQSVTFTSIVRSVSNESKDILLSNKLQIVKHSWIEDALANSRRSNEEAYSLRDSSVSALSLNTNDICTPERSLAPMVTRKMCPKRGHRSTMIVDDSSSESDEIIPRRQLSFSDVCATRDCLVGKSVKVTEKNSHKGARKRPRWDATARGVITHREHEDARKLDLEKSSKDVDLGGSFEDGILGIMLSTTGLEPESNCKETYSGLYNPKDNQIEANRLDYAIKASSNGTTEPIKDSSIIINDNIKTSANRTNDDMKGLPNRINDDIKDCSNRTNDDMKGSPNRTNDDIKGVLNKAPDESFTQYDVLASQKDQGCSTLQGTTTNTKKKVSYKDLVGKFFN